MFLYLVSELTIHNITHLLSSLCLYCIFHLSASGCTYTWNTYAQQNAPGLTQQVSISTLAICQSTCIATTGCLSIDFNSQANTCWFGFTANPALTANTASTHY